MKLLKKLHIKVFSKKSFDNTSINKGDIVKLYRDLTNNTTKGMGRVQMALCPFHGEKTPSFALYPESSSYTCWGCGETGDTITLLMKLKRITFVEALEELKQFI